MLTLSIKGTNRTCINDEELGIRGERSSTREEDLLTKVVVIQDTCDHYGASWILCRMNGAGHLSERAKKYVKFADVSNLLDTGGIFDGLEAWRSGRPCEQGPYRSKYGSFETEYCVLGWLAFEMDGIQ